jgi:WWE domain
MGNSFSNIFSKSNKTKFTCKGCKTKINTDTQFHCDKCHFVYDLDPNSNNVFKHCCLCKVKYTNDNHCCKCGLVWDENNIFHCCVCKVKIDIFESIGKFHCCKCKKLHSSEDKHCATCCVVHNDLQHHCCKCKNIYDYNKIHCKICCVTHESTQDHCCKCKKIYDFEDIHCKMCCVTHEMVQDHCCKCKKTYYFEDIHCKECCMTYSGVFKHCCKCKETYNLAEKHCKVCCTTYAQTERHCCKCKENYNNECIHCGECCITYDNDQKHCCKCKKIYNHCEVKHCFMCCGTFKSKNYHCCICKFQWNKEKGLFICKCDSIKRLINCFIFEWMIKLNCKQKYTISHCLNEDCTAFNIFNKTIIKLGFSGIYDFLMSEKNWIIMFHGTSNLSRAMNICCNSWDIDRRTRQLHGEGEYFATSLSTAQKYAGKNGAIIISLIINPAISNNLITKIYCKTDENDMWYVINNKKDECYCLPIAILEVKTNIQSYKLCPKKMLALVPKKIYYQNDKNDFVSYSDVLQKFMITNIRNKKFIFYIKIGDIIYNINFENMTQTNTDTGYERSMLIL